MLRIDLQAPQALIPVSTLPKNLRFSLLGCLQRVFLPVLLHPTRAGCLNCSFKSPFTFLLSSWPNKFVHDTSAIHTGDERKCEVIESDGPGSGIDTALTPMTDRLTQRKKITHMLNRHL